MSLIPYHPREGREIVLRHRNAIVVRDPASHRLEIRGITECPTCHQALPGASSSDRPFDRAFEMNHESYVDPDYFRMLHAGVHGTTSDHTPPSPVRRIFNPALGGGGGSRGYSASPDIVDSDAEFVSSTPGVAQADGSRIRREAFSPNYFRTFFIEEKVLGRGGKGVVMLVRHEIDGCALGHFACKRVPVGDDHAWLEKVLIEVELLAKLSHPNLVSYRHVWLEDVQLNRFGPKVACAFILQQYCNGGDLHQYVIGGTPREATKEELKAQMRRRSKGQAEGPQIFFSPNPRLSFEEIYSLFRDITSGVAYLHAANYIHRDLKPNNCLLHRDGGKLVCLISDFGEVQPEHVVRKSSGSTGTISYCAPEVLRMDTTGHYGNFTTKSDIFSLGMILYFMCFGRLPYQSANAIQEELEDIELLRSEITDWKGFQGERRERPDLPSKLYTLLQRLLALNATDRPSAAEVLNAMRNESNFDGMTRSDRSTSPPVNLTGRRIQSLDSPATPGTPIADDRNLRRRRTRTEQDWTEPTAETEESIAQDRKSTLEWPPPTETIPHHAQSMAMTRSSNSPEDSEMTGQANAYSRSNGDSPFAPPLLLEPPRSTIDDAGHGLQIALHRISVLIGINEDFISHTLRLSLFFAKLATLARPCWPYMSTWEVSIPLILIAVLDLGHPSFRRMPPGWVNFDSGSALPVNPLVSLGLLLLHLAVLWVANRWEALCVVAHPDPWGGWQETLTS